MELKTQRLSAPFEIPFSNFICSSAARGSREWMIERANDWMNERTNVPQPQHERSIIYACPPARPARQKGERWRRDVVTFLQDFPAPIGLKNGSAFLPCRFLWLNWMLNGIWLLLLTLLLQRDYFHEDIEMETWSFGLEFLAASRHSHYFNILLLLLLLAVLRTLPLPTMPTTELHHISH